jgi:tryptophan-rich sensory protein
MFKLARTFLEAVLPSVVKPLHILWNEVIGFVFIVLAAATAPAGWRYYRALQIDSNNVFRLMLTVAFGATMAWFGITSFLKARKIRRQVQVSALYMADNQFRR